jgi:AcrR family transcriptional regulator
MTLILEKGYDAVTVEDITNRADLGRTTFYLHYQDKEELLLESIESIANDLKSQVDLNRIARMQDQALPRPIHLAFRHAADHAALYRIILNGEGATRTAARLRRFISENAAEFLALRLSLPGEPHAGSPIAASDKDVRLIADYFASSLLGFLTWWLEADMPYPPDDMADFFLQVFFRGAGDVLGLPGTTTPRV